MTRHIMLGAMLSGLLVPASTLAAPIEPLDVQDAAPSADTLVADASVVVRAGGVRVSGPAGRVTVTRPPPVPRVAPRVQAAPPPALAPRPTGGFQVDLRMAPAPGGPRVPPPPPPGVSVPPPPASAAPPPPAGGSVYHPPAPPSTVWHSYRGPTVYYYPRIYSTVWGWWWWAPSCYSCYNYGDAPSRPRQSDDGEREERKEREALHVGDYSFGVWGGVQRGLYQDGSVYSDPGLRFSLRHRVSDHLGVDFSGGYFGTPLYPDDADRNSHRVDVPLQLSATFHLFPELPIQVYGLLGVTADYRDFEKVAYTEGAKDFYYTGTRFQDLCFGPNAGLGAEVMIGEDVSIHGDARWTYYSVAAEESLDQTVPASFSANAGVSVFF